MAYIVRSSTNTVRTCPARYCFQSAVPFSNEAVAGERCETVRAKRATVLVTVHGAGG